ncbi:MAG: hypothetical protein GY729_06505 [Desulfobacteraceae bacterium]|nr:hypothetical protein [Desulfobacteraceae bacterium]
MMKPFKIIIGCVSLVLIIFTEVYCEDPWSVSGLLSGARVVGEGCWSTGQFATPQNVSTAANIATSLVNTNTTVQSGLIQTQVLEAAKVIAQELAKNRKSNEELLNMQLAKIYDWEEGKNNIENTKYVKNLFGDISKIKSICAAPGVATKMQVNDTTIKKAEQDLEKWFYDYSWQFDSIKDIEDHHSDGILDENGNDTNVKGDNIIPNSGSHKMTKDSEAGEWEAPAKVASLLLDPMPALNLSKSQTKSTEVAKKYAFARKVKKASLLIPQMVFNKNIAEHLPTLELEDHVNAIYSDMGRDSGYEPLELVDGKISQAAMTDLLVKSRYKNPNWYSTLMVKNEVGLLRELLSMKALQLDMQRQQLEWTRLTSLLLAQDIADKTNDQMNPVLDELYQQTASDSQN